ncbi:inositol polyphosphate kinase KCS1 NDAI_0A05900 [Naumovozyma dairenensis CBS 421]|uniref:Kinase n=1 Tax=Naumovozyma dairenensis (strain ATCC 10597 / BCRC 20456 / CBS 421 / NBRC 0211 / NRRL Y-12639) TaxID=1071378 RepID=G0W4K7_NAUDC|nr:hypothetical protein NDAI_0A05900 [Naumovozyma dairenensis CBS 421]CCD22745.1 hypothetical protein NDAI_0A05900 [Naumovozyma dairenensis CBS 421]
MSSLTAIDMNEAVKQKYPKKTEPTDLIEQITSSEKSRHNQAMIPPSDDTTTYSTPSSDLSTQNHSRHHNDKQLSTYARHHHHHHHHHHHNVEDSITNLKDLNVADKKKLPKVLHGRKASTYLRIFRDDENLTDTTTENPNSIPQQDETENINILDKKQSRPGVSSSSSYLNQRHSRIDPSPSNITTGSPPKKNIRDHKVNDRSNKINEKARNAVKIIIKEENGNRKIDDTQDGRILQEQDRKSSTPSRLSGHLKIKTSDNSKNPSDDLALEPVSSATYYPHKSKSKSKKKVDKIEDKDEKPSNIKESSSLSVLLSNQEQENLDFSISKVPKNQEENSKQILPSSQLNSIVESHQLHDYNDRTFTNEIRNKNDIINEKENNNEIRDEEAHNIPAVDSMIQDNQEGLINTPKDATNIDFDKYEEDEGDDDEDEDEDEDEDQVKEYPLAVELKPFTNKVGGHTAIFRFSKRAVCKTLVNRENKFYENIELNHKDLLQFMPKYIGVLNVRQHFYRNNINCDTCTNNTKFPDYTNVTNNNDENQISSNNDKNKMQKKIVTEREDEPDLEGGALLQHIHSYPTDSSPILFKEKTTKTHHHSTTQPHNIINNDNYYYKDSHLPEVVINDNKHIIPDSLWGKYSHSPSSAPSDSYINSISHISSNHNSIDTEAGSDGNIKPACNDTVEQKRHPFYTGGGSTTINTKLKDLILQEVFAPTFCARRRKSSKMTSTPMKSSNSTSNKEIATASDMIKNTTQKQRSSSQDYSHNSNLSLTTIQDSKTSIRGKHIKDSITPKNIDTSNSLMDLKQLHSRELEKEKYINDYSSILENPRYESNESKNTVDSNNDNTFNLNNNTTFSSRATSRSLSPSQYNSRSPSPLSEPKVLPDEGNNLVKYENENDNTNIGRDTIFEMDPLASEDATGSTNETKIPILKNDVVALKNETIKPSLSQETEATLVSKFILLEDLTRNLSKPCALDLKMGTRQYGVDAKRSKQLSQRAKCLKTTSRKLGVRICGLKIWNREYYIKRDKYFGRRVKIGWQFARVLARFIYDGVSTKSIIKQIPNLIKQLDKLNNEISKLKGYRLYGSSLLLMYDGEDIKSKHFLIKVNLIDFAKCISKKDLDENLENFKIPPKSIDVEDKGFLRGIRSLKFYLLLIWNYLTHDEPMIYDEVELDKFIEVNAEKLKLDENWDWLDNFDKEDEAEFNDSQSELRKKWRKYELIFDVEPRFNNNDDEISD